MLLHFMVNRKRLLAFGLALSAAVAAGIYLLLVFSAKTFYSGIYAGDIDLSGLTRLQAEILVKNTLEERFRDRAITLRYKDQAWKIGLQDIRFGFHIEEALDRAYGIGRSGGVFSRLKVIADTAFHKVHINPELFIDKDKLSLFLEGIRTEIFRKKKDAGINYQKGVIAFERDVTGVDMDIDKNQDLVENCILNGNLDDIWLNVTERKPKIRYEDIKEIDGELASFQTTFNAGDANRSHNIRLACERINNTLLLPGEIFSMNRALGPRTIENGYREAPVIYKNELVKGPGGGICQVTTTLYAAVLRARLEVIERRNHSLPLAYVAPGQDATIAEGSIDFKFQNRPGYDREEYPIGISAEAAGNRIIIRILGKNDSDGHVVRLKSDIVKEYAAEEEELIADESIPEGERLIVQKERSGMKVIVYREVYSENGELLDVEKISEDVYRPVRAQVKVNPKDLAALEIPADY